MNKSRGDRLYTVAESQGGYFTAADAKVLGYLYPHQHFHVKRGNWIRVDRGIFRLKHFPSAAHEDLIFWWLWSRKQGVISHESAAALYGLGEVIPRKTHLTVPQMFRKIAPRAVILHKAELKIVDRAHRDGLAVTTPGRTIVDLARAQFDHERLGLVARDALRKGLVTGSDLLTLLTEMPKGIDAEVHVTLRLAVREVE